VDGKIAVEYLVKYRKEKLVLWSAKSFQEDTEKKVEVRDGRVYFTNTVKGKVDKADIKLNGILLVPDDVGKFVAKNWKAIKGREKKFRVMVPVFDMQTTMKFEILREEVTEIDSIKVMVVKIWINDKNARRFFPPALISFELNPPHRLVEAEGLTAPKKKEGGQWFNLNAYIKFSYPK